MTFETIGNVEILSQTKLAIFCSRKYSSEVESKSISLMQKIAKLPICLAGGWQAPLEKKLFKQLALHKARPHLIYYLAKNINLLRTNVLQQNLINNEQLLVVAPPIDQNRQNKKLVGERDKLIFRQVKKILFLSISDGGQLENYLKELSQKNYQIFILEDESNEKYYGSDIVVLNEDNLNLLFC